MAIDASENVYNMYDYGVGGITYVRKYTSSGSTSFTHTAYNSHSWEPKAIAADNNNNYYIAGYTSPASYNRGFLTAKFDQFGNKLWENVFGGTGDQESYGREMTIDDSSNIYIMGIFNKTVSFGGHSITTGSGTASVAKVFLTKINSSGTVVWAKALGSTLSTYGYDVELSQDKQSVYLISNNQLIQTDLNGNLLNTTTLQLNATYEGLGTGPGMDVYVGGTINSQGLLHGISCTPPSVSIGANTGACTGDMITLSAGVDSVDWMDANGNLLSANSPDYSFPVNSTEQVTARKTDAIGCPGYATITVEAYPLYTTYDTVEICANESYWAGGQCH
jgi:hypothetical protein